MELENARILERIKRAYGVRKDHELLKIWGYNPSGTISNWRKRGIPQDILVRTAEDTGVSIETLLEGYPERPEPKGISVETLTEREVNFITFFRGVDGDVQDLYYDLLAREYVVRKEKS